MSEEVFCSKGCGRRLGRIRKDSTGLCRPCYVAQWKAANPWHYGDIPLHDHYLDDMSYQEWSGNYGRKTPDRNEGTESQKYH